MDNIDELTDIMSNNENVLGVIKNMQKYLQALYSVEDSIDTKLLEREKELHEYKLMLEENMNFLKKITGNLIIN
jgi:hypothetical protein